MQLQTTDAHGSSRAASSLRIHHDDDAIPFLARQRGNVGPESLARVGIGKILRTIWQNPTGGHVENRNIQPADYKHLRKVQMFSKND
jgi:hypothetical protein